MQSVKKDLIIFLNETKWSSLSDLQHINIDKRIKFRLFDEVFNLWLIYHIAESEFESKKSKFKNGKYKKLSKVNSDEIYRTFSIYDLEKILFLIFSDFFQSHKALKMEMISKFFKAIELDKLPLDVRNILSNIKNSLAKNNENGSLDELFIKKISRAKKLLLNLGFSHIRLDPISANIRLCPVVKEIDEIASLRMSQQPQMDEVSELLKSEWFKKTGDDQRCFYEIAIDARLNKLHKQEQPDLKIATLTKKTNEKAPKFGIVKLPKVHELLQDPIFIRILQNETFKSMGLY